MWPIRLKRRFLKRNNYEHIFGQVVLGCGKMCGTEVGQSQVEGLSVSMGRVMTLFVLVLVLAIVVASFALGCVFLIGDLIGSWAGAAFIVGGVFLLFLIVLCLLRRRLFVNMFVRLFVEVLYDEE